MPDLPGELPLFAGDGLIPPQFDLQYTEIVFFSARTHRQPIDFIGHNYFFFYTVKIIGLPVDEIDVPALYWQWDLTGGKR